MTRRNRMNNRESHLQAKVEFPPHRQTDGITKQKYEMIKGKGRMPRMYGFSILSQSTAKPKVIKINRVTATYPGSANSQNACQSGLLPRQVSLIKLLKYLPSYGGPLFLLLEILSYFIV
jgi:hypothetical protein